MIGLHGRGGLFEFWSFRMLLASLVRRNLTLKYKRSLLGFVWTLMNPLLSMAVLVVVFSTIVRLPVERYWAFLLSGYFAWTFVIQMLSTGTYVFREHSGLRRSVAFPNDVLVYGAAGARLVEFLAELVLVVAVLAVFHHGELPASLLFLPALVALQVLLAVGIALPLATLSVSYNDVEHALPIVLSMLFYVSPVFYPASMVPPQLQALYFANPLAGLLTMYHAVLYEGIFPAPGLFALTAGLVAAITTLGYVIYHRQRALLPEIG